MIRRLWEDIQDVNRFANAPSAPRRMTASSPRKLPPRSKLRTGWALAGIAAGLMLVSAPVRAQQALPSWNDAAQAAWWTANPTADTWPKAADALQAQLEAA